MSRRWVSKPEATFTWVLPGQGNPQGNAPYVVSVSTKRCRPFREALDDAPQGILLTHAFPFVPLSSIEGPRRNGMGDEMGVPPPGGPCVVLVRIGRPSDRRPCCPPSPFPFPRTGQAGPLMLGKGLVRSLRDPWAALSAPPHAGATAIRGLPGTPGSESTPSKTRLAQSCSRFARSWQQHVSGGRVLHMDCAEVGDP